MQGEDGDEFDWDDDGGRDPNFRSGWWIRPIIVAWVLLLAALALGKCS